MITLHESNITSLPQDNGIGVLRDVIRAYAEEELNGMFEFYMEYDSEGHLVDELKEERIIKAKAQDKLGYQLFRIYSITKNHENDNLIVQAQHITYDLADNFVESLEARNLTKKQVMEKIGSSTAYPHPFNVTSSNTTTISSTSLYRTNPLQMIGGMEGSVLQIWGGQIERDNFNLILHDRRGSDDGVKVTYEKNITGLEATFDISGLVTRIFPFVYIEATDDEPERLITVSGKYIDSPHINDYEKIYIEPIDYSSDERINTDGTDAQIRQQLTNIASKYFEETGNDKIKVDMEVQFEHLWETEEYKDLAVLELVGMGDTVTIEHSRLKVDATAIVNYIRYDCIAEKNEEVRLGSVKARLTDSVNKVVDVAEKAERVEQTANQAIKTANGKNTIYYGPDEPEGGIEGDLWFRVVDGEYTRTYRHDGIQWQLVLSVDVRDAIDEAQQAKDDAQQAVERANQATQQATNAINQAQTAFDEAQQALSTASNALDVADDALTTAQSAIDTASHAASVAESANELAELLQTTVNGHTTAISNIENELSLKMNTVDADNKYATQLQLTATSSSLSSQITSVQGDVDNLQTNFSSLSQTVSSLTTRVGDAEGNITALQQTSVSLAGRLSDAEGNITTLTATVNGLQTTVSNVQGDVSSVTQLANALQTRMTNAEGDISTLTQTASSLQSVIEGMGTENNIIPNGSFENGELGWILHSRATIYIGDSKHGSNSLRIVGGSGTISQRLTLNTVPVEPGHTYKIEYWVKTSSDFNGVSGNNKLRLGYSSNETSAVHYSVGWTGPLTEWTKMESIWTVPNDVTRITPTIVSNHTQGWVLWDNIVVRDINDIKDMATQSQITQLSNAINLRVMKGDVINQINISDESILIDGRKVHITGQTTIDNGVIKSAHIES